MTRVDRVDQSVLHARAFLSRVAEPANVAMWAFVERVGPIEAVAAIQAGSAPSAVLNASDARRLAVEPEVDLEAADRHGIRLVAPESGEWPRFALVALERIGRLRAKALESGTFARRESGEQVPPLALWVKGSDDLSTAGIRSVALVGSRASTAYGELVTADLAYGLVGFGVTVVSGGAYGIDATAHRGALAGGGSTILVSAGGLDRPYPAGNATLFDQVTQAGLLVSESPPGAAPQRHRFLSRNRLIAAFSTGTVVVEAALRSGAANTATHAAAMGRPVMAVPGPVTSPMSAGCHALLRQVSDSVLVTGVDDVLAVVGSMGEGITPTEPAEGSGACPHDLRDELDRLDPMARRVFDGLPVRHRARADEIATRSGVPIVEVIRALPGLDLAGLIEVTDAGYRVAPRLRLSRSAVHR